MNERFLTATSQVESLSNLNNIEFLARQIVDGFISGIHKSPYHGFSVEFAEHRIYNQGESIKHIDWKLYGRTDKLFVKKYEAETNLRCNILIDTSSSMFYPVDKMINKAGFSALCAAAMIYLLAKQRDAVGLSLFDSKMNFNVPAKLSLSHQKTMFQCLDDLLNQKYNPSNMNETATPQILHQISEAIPKRSLVVIFSDMFINSPQAELFNAFEHLRYNKHEVVVFHVTHKKTELFFTLENRPYRIIDMESGDILKLNPQEFREFYCKQIDLQVDELRKRCLQYQIDFVEADIDNPFQQVLTPWFVKRGKMK